LPWPFWVSSGRACPDHKVFLTALAIVDDLGAVLVIAVFYTTAINLPAMVAVGASAAVLVALNRAGVSSLGPYLVLGIGLWLAVHESGVHATLAGVLLAMVIPSRTRVDAFAFAAKARALLDEFDRGETGDALVLTSTAQQETLHALANAATAVEPPLLRLERRLHHPVALLVMPAFALANAGVRLTAVSAAFWDPIALGIALGLLVGKTFGIMLCGWLAVRIGLATLPANVTWRDLLGLAWLGGIGFTMALFVAGLAFEGSPRLETAKAGVIVASAIAGIIGYTTIRQRLRSISAQTLRAAVNRSRRVRMGAASGAVARRGWERAGQACSTTNCWGARLQTAAPSEPCACLLDCTGRQWYRQRASPAAHRP